MELLKIPALFFSRRRLSGFAGQDIYGLLLQWHTAVPREEQLVNKHFLIFDVRAFVEANLCSPYLVFLEIAKRNGMRIVMATFWEQGIEIKRKLSVGLVVLNMISFMTDAS